MAVSGRAFLFPGVLGAILLQTGCAAIDTRPDDKDPVITAEPVGVNNDVVAMLVKVAQERRNGTAAKSGSGGPVPTAPAPEGLQEAQAKATAQSGNPRTEEKNGAPGRKPASLVKRKKGATIAYVVKPGDTLMKISFETFGDLRRWREIHNLNKDKVRNPSVLTPGTVLKIYLSDYVVVEKNGKPYLIRRHDTLVKISRGIYGTPAKWKKLWHNNRQLIHDPNKIYAGFHLYYVMSEQDQIEAERLKARMLGSSEAPTSPAPTAAPARTPAAAPIPPSN